MATGNAIIDQHFANWANHRRESHDVMLDRLIPVGDGFVSMSAPSREVAGGEGDQKPGESEWTWVSANQFSVWCRDLANMLPNPIRGVCGVPRGGMLAASLVACHLNVPLYGSTPDGPVLLPSSGRRLREAEFIAGPLVVVDDDSWSGKTLKRAAETAKGEVVTASILVRSQGILPDFYVHQWDHWWTCEHRFFSCWMVPKTGYDFDGILCRDCRNEEDDDGLKYMDFIQGADPLWVPRGFTIPVIATARTEKYRAETERWLRLHGVRWSRLVMGGWDSLSDRTFDRVVQAKVDATKSLKLQFFCESDPTQAAEINRRSGLIVFCPPTGEVFQVNARAEEQARRREAAAQRNRERAARREEQRKKHATRSEKPVVDVPACQYRGEIVGKLNCGCQGAPVAYGCSYPTNPIWTDPAATAVRTEPGCGFCTLHVAKIKDKVIRVQGGQNLEMPRAMLPACAVCRVAREAAKPAWNPPAAPDDVAAARRAICGSCEVKDQCGMPDKLVGYLRVGCPDGKWPAGGGA